MNGSRASFITLVALILLTPVAFAADAPPARVSIELKRKWEPIVLPSLDMPTADCVGMDLFADHATFTTTGAGIGLFEYPLHVPVSVERFPILALKYRARGLDTARDKPGLWVDDRGGPQAFGTMRPVVTMDQLVADGEVREVRKDLRDAGLAAPVVTRLILGVVAKEGGRASIELIEATFEPAPAGAVEAPAAPAAAATPIVVEVFSRDGGQPVAGAAVTVDAERKDAARAAKTDAAGKATVAPAATDDAAHAVYVEADGMAPAEYTVKPGEATAESPLRVELVPAVVIGGFVQDEQGKPIAGATVRVFARPTQPPPPGARISRRAVMTTNADGQWQAPPMPADGDVMTKLAHPEYASDKEYNETPLPPIEQLKEGSGVQVMKKP